MAAVAVAFALTAALSPLSAQSHGELSPNPRLGATVAEVVSEFYALRDPGDVWLSGAARDTALDLLDAAARGHEHGLCVDDAAPGTLRTSLERQPPSASNPELDYRVTESLATFLLQLALGRHTVATGETLSARTLHVGSLLEQAAYGRPARDVLDVAAPRHPEYRQLQHALAEYRHLAQSGGWPELPGDTRLHPERPADPAMVRAVAERLRISGDLDRGATLGDDESSLSASYDDTLVAAVRTFQARHGLAVDGIVGPATARALNVPIEIRMQQLVINLDRWRRLPDRLGDAHVRVNIPGFQLQAREHGRTVLSMRTVVGTPENQTPVFSDRIRYLEFNPYWNVPRSITVNELVPRAAEDPSYLERQGFEVLDGWSPDAESIDPAAVDWEAERFSYRLRQRPGPDNALGLVKFMFPNRYSVYLHDTPARHLFAVPGRARSHGCVRVAQPAELAAWLLQPRGWDVSQAAAAMDSDTRQVVRLPEPVPVHLVYFTAWVDERGDVQFREDVYDRDARASRWFECAVRGLSS